MVITDYAKHWELSIPLIWGEEYVDSLEAILKERGVKKILDCACGTGFPSIELRKRGFDIYASDGDKEMLKRFNERLKEKNVRIKNFYSDWVELPKKIKECFDLVMVRGNSLVFATSWKNQKGNSAFDYQKADKKIERALKSFYYVLKPSGILYIDIPNNFEPVLVAQHGGEEKFPNKRIDGKTIGLSFKIKYLYNRKCRINDAVLSIDGKKFLRRYNSYFIPHRRLEFLMKKAGFVVEPYIPINGENTYDIFFGVKK